MGGCPTKAVAVRHRPSRTIAMLVSPIGWRVGLWPKRLGAAAMKARDAHQQLVGALRGAEIPHSMFLLRGYLALLNLMVAALALVPSSGAQLQRSEGSDRRVE